MLSIYNNPNDLDVAVVNFHEINNDEKRFSDMWLLNSFVCSYPNERSNIYPSKFKYDFNFIKLPTVEPDKTDIMLIGNQYLYWENGKILVDNKYSDTFRTLLYTYNNDYELNYTDEIIFNLCNNNENIIMIDYIKQINNLFITDKQNIIHFQAGAKNLIRYFKKSIINNHM